MVDMNDLHAHDISLELRNTLQQLLINRDSFSCLNNNLSFKLPGRGSKRHMHQWKSKGKGIMQTSLCCFQIQLVDLMPHVSTE